MKKLFLFLIILCVLITFIDTSVLAKNISITAVGDIMMGSLTPRKVLPNEMHLNQARKMQKYLSGADIVFGNLEGVFVESETPPKKCSEASRNAKKCFEFGMPIPLADILVDMGFTVLNIDNNHTADYGEEGYLLTQDILTEKDIYAVPKGGNVIIRVQKNRIAIVAFGFTKNSYLVSNIKHTQRIISNLSKRYPIVIVSFHGGKEGKDAQHVKDEIEMFYGENRGNLIAFSHAAVDAGADLIIGHGPHVLRALECYKNRLIVYSLGNFYTFGQFRLSGPAGIGAILNITISDQNGQFVQAKIIPTVQVMAGVPAYDRKHAAIQIFKDLTSEDFPQTPLQIADDGTIYLKKK
ncbi:metallophosphatase [Candidatus Magnetomorum sp. HK-1]|nr:metallophosphatase [Candidatus Magnetomorum sp. HK-1]